MAYDEHLGERIATALQKEGVVFKEKKMMGGPDFNPRARRSRKKGQAT